MQPIRFRTVIEVLGRPKEHVEQALQKYVEQLKSNKKYTTHRIELSPSREMEQGMCAQFAEVELSTAQLSLLTDFCIDYMPSVIDVLEPEELKVTDIEFSQFLNDLQAKLHAVDMVAKQVKMENNYLKQNMVSLLKNYLTVLLSKQDLTVTQLSGLTGIQQDRLADYLDLLIDEGKVDLKGDLYSLQNKKPAR